MDLVKSVYLLIPLLPDKERFGLVSQISRAAVSVPSNIAEGAGRDSSKEFAHFLSIARGSLYELETQLLISKDLYLIPEEKLLPVLAIIEEVQKMAFALKQKLTSK